MNREKRDRETSWRLAQAAGAVFTGILPLLLSGADPLRELPSMARGLDPLLQCGILQWVLRHPPLHASAWQAPFFWPAPWSLAYMDSLAGQALLVAPLPGMGSWPALAYNLALIGTLSLAFLAAVRLARELGLPRAAAWMAALVYAAGPHAAGHYHHLNQLPTPWLPLALWGLLLLARGRWDGLLPLVLSLLLQPLWGFYNLASLWMAVLLAILLLLPSWRGGRGLALLVVIAGGLGWAWFSGAPYREAADVVAGFSRGPGSVGPYAGRPFDLLHPPSVHLLPWPRPLPGRPVLYAGWIWPWLAAAGFWTVLGMERSRERRRLWIALAVACGMGLLLAFGRHMPLPGLGEVPLPLAWLQDRFWVLQSLRAPTRLFLPGMLFLGLAGARAWTWWTIELPERRRIPRSVGLVGGAIFALALLDLMPGSLETVRAHPDREERALLKVLAHDRESGAWMAFPTPCREQEERSLDARCMLWAAWIDRPVAGGSSGFVPMEVRRLRRSCCRGPGEFCIADLRRMGVSEIVLPRAYADGPPVGVLRVWEGSRWQVWRLR